MQIPSFTSFLPLCLKHCCIAYDNKAHNDDNSYLNDDHNLCDCEDKNVCSWHLVSSV